MALQIILAYKMMGLSELAHMINRNKLKTVEEDLSV